MPEDNATDLIAALDKLLSEERAALIGGDLDQITRLAPQKEALMTRLGQITDLERQPVADLQNKILRNQALFDHALEGIRTVSRRLSALRKVRGTLDIYDQSGAKKSVTFKDGGSLEKRA